MSKCWYCNEELTTSNYCDEHVGICTKCYGSMFQVSNEFVKGLTDKIADLEAKLAEKDTKLHEYIKCALEDYNDNTKEILELKKQLAEKEQTIEEINKEFVQAVKDWKLLVEQKEKEIEKITRIVAYRDDMDMSTVINGVKFTNEQIITLQNIDYFADKHNQDKISFAVEQLNKLWDCLYKTDDKGYIIKFASMNDRDKFNEAFDNQIKQLKEMK